MRAVVQRVSSARVSVDQRPVGEIGSGLVVSLGVAADDEEKDVEWMASKVVELRILADEAGKMNRSVEEAGGALLVVSQFTLLGDCRKGRSSCEPGVSAWRRVCSARSWQSRWSTTPR